MSNWPSGHPDDGLLLRYLDGELPSRKARQVKRHLEACWQCRADLESLEATVAECMRYRKQVLAARLPEAPAPWSDLRRGFDRVDASLAAESFWKRLTYIPRSWQWSAAAVAAAAVLVAVFFQLRQTPSVQAAVLLRKAVAAANTQPAHTRRILIRTRTAQVARTIGTTRAAYAPMPTAIDVLFETAHYDANDPLSARAFQAWHDSLAEKTDTVAAIPDPRNHAEDCSEIRTVPEGGDVSTATMTFRDADLEPVAGRLEFRDRNWIEFTRVEESPTQEEGALVANPVEAPVRPAVPSRPAAVAPRSMASISDELQVLSALQRIGADLGDPVEVKREDGRVMVSGIGIAPQRQRQIQAALDGMPHVTVEFSEPGAAPAAAQGTSAAGTIAAEPANPHIEANLERQLGGRAELDRFTSQMLESNEAAMSHAYALRGLAERFPAAGEQPMSEKDLAVLRGMVRGHLAALTAQADRMETVLQPVLAGLGGSAAAPSASKASPQAWQAGVVDLFAASRHVEVLLSQLLGVTPADKALPNLPSQLLTALRDWRADLDQCQKLAAQ